MINVLEYIRKRRLGKLKILPKFSIREYTRQWRLKNSEKVKEYSIQRRLEHSMCMRQWYVDNKVKHLESMKKYRQTGAGKIAYKKARARRGRDLGFNPMNEQFEGSEGHHINKEDVIYISKELHRSVYHNQETGQGMQEINDLTQEFLLSELGEC